MATPGIESADDSLNANGNAALSEAERALLLEELKKTEDEVSTLRQLLTARQKHVAHLKRKLGLSGKRAHLSQNQREKKATQQQINLINSKLTELEKEQREQAAFKKAEAERQRKEQEEAKRKLEEEEERQRKKAEAEEEVRCKAEEERKRQAEKEEERERQAEEESQRKAEEEAEGRKRKYKEVERQRKESERQRKEAERKRKASEEKAERQRKVDERRREAERQRKIKEAAEAELELLKQQKQKMATNYKQKVDPTLKVELKDKWGKGGKVKPQQQNIGTYLPNSESLHISQQPRSHSPMPRNQEIMDDKHVLQKLQQIQLDIDEIRNVERLASLVEKTLKAVSDSMVEANDANTEQVEQDRILKGVKRVGNLAKHLLLKSDNQIDLVVFCSKLPTVTMLMEVSKLFKKYAEIHDDEQLVISEMTGESAISVSISSIPFNCRITLTSVLLRKVDSSDNVDDQIDLLPRGPCLNALAELRHARFYQVKCTLLHSINSTVKIIRDITQRVRTWIPLNTWAIEILVEKALSSTEMALSPGDAVRRVFELMSSGVYLSKRSKLIDPCEKEEVDVIAHITDQEREDIASSAQHALRLIAYNQIYKILGIDQLPDQLPPNSQNGGGAKFTGMKRRSDGSSAGQIQDSHQNPAATGQEEIPAGSPETKKGKIDPNEVKQEGGN